MLDTLRLRDSRRFFLGECGFIARVW